MNIYTEGKYILDKDGNPVEEHDLLKWGDWFENHRAERVLRRDEVSEDVLVSTVFLGLDHSFGDGPVLLWETMTFNTGSGESGEVEERYSTKEEAIAGHERIVAELKAKQNADSSL